ncbi:MAG: ATP-binding protein [Pseudobdellovibrio sp.]
MQINRYIQSYVQDWLGSRMVFIGGPRQVGKTYLAKTFLNSKLGYMTWDSLSDQERIKKHQIPTTEKTIVLDEIHKYPRWRMLTKGLYDKNKEDLQIIVTGSARLDHFRKGGDSLFGRYHYLRLHPFSVNELDSQCKMSTVHELLRYGGFPEPFLKQSDSFTKIWRRERNAKVIHQDLRDITNLKDYIQLEMLSDLLPERVGSLLSFNSLGEDLSKSPHTISHWIDILGSVYQCFTIAPHGPPKVKAVKKQQKLYLWDWCVVQDPGARFENLVASHLLKYCHFIEDTQGDDMELRFIRDQFGREIDFLILKNKKPLFAVECKTGEKKLSPHINYYKERTDIPFFYQVHLGTKSYKQDGIFVLPFNEFCKNVGLV